MTARAVAGALLAALTLGCETVLPPLRGEVEVGRDAYAIFVGGEGVHSDLYALAPDRGAIWPLTYTAVAELAPALSLDGGQVALLRAATLRDSVPGSAWVLNLVNGNERELVLPRGAGAPRRIGWARAGNAIFIATDSLTYRFDAPLGRTKPRVVSAAQRASADSSFAVLLGDPVVAEAVTCEAGQALCVTSKGGPPEPLVSGAREPLRWGSDSIGYFVGDRLEIRPLGGGRVRLAVFNNPPVRPRAMTFFPGRPGRAP